MPRPPTGQVVEYAAKDGCLYRSLRFTAYGKRRRMPLGPVSRDEAERQLGYILADVARGTWTPPTAVSPPPEPERVPTFHEFAEEWWTLTRAQLAPSTQADYSWRLQVHLIKHFGELPLDRITFDTVERYIATKLAEDDPLSPRSINMTITLLGAILERAVERELIARNPARGRGRRVKEAKPRRSYLETAGQIAALLDASGELDRAAPKDRRHFHRRAMLATLTFAGLRIGELLALRWRDVDLAAGWLTVRESKTDAGVRRVKIRGALRDELASVRAGQDGDGFVFPTRTGGQLSAANFRNRILAATIKRANENLAGTDQPPLPDGLTPHSLRRTFASLLYALGEPPPVVMAEMGHTDAALALKVYAQALRLGEQENAQLAALVEGEPLPGVSANKWPTGQETANGQTVVGGASTAKPAD